MAIYFSLIIMMVVACSPFTKKKTSMLLVSLPRPSHGTTLRAVLVTIPSVDGFCSRSSGQPDD